MFGETTNVTEIFVISTGFSFMKPLKYKLYLMSDVCYLFVHSCYDGCADSHPDEETPVEVLVRDQ